MQKIGVFTIGLVLLTMTCASAEVYRCRTADGKLVMTDQQTQLPADCVPVDGPIGAGSFNVMPSTTGAAVESPGEQPGQEAAVDSTATSPLQDQANDLVQSYQEAVQKRYRASIVADQRRAIQEIVELRQQKQQMLNDLPRSGLTGDAQQAVRETLDQIPQQ